MFIFIVTHPVNSLGNELWSANNIFMWNYKYSALRLIKFIRTIGKTKSNICFSYHHKMIIIFPIYNINPVQLGAKDKTVRIPLEIRLSTYFTIPEMPWKEVLWVPGPSNEKPQGPSCCNSLLHTRYFLTLRRILLKN